MEGESAAAQGDPRLTDRAAAVALDALRAADITPDQADVHLVENRDGSLSVRVYSDELVLTALRAWRPELAPGLRRPFGDGHPPELLTLHTVPGLAELRQLFPDRLVHIEVAFAGDPRPDEPTTPLHERPPAPPVTPAPRDPLVGPGGVRMWQTPDGNLLPVDRSGYRLQPRDVAFIGADQPVTPFDQRAIDLWREGLVPLGMPPALYEEFKADLRAALQADGIDPDGVDIRLKGSAGEFFSGLKKHLPTPAELEGKPEARARLDAWLQGEPGPEARPFDAGYRLGVDRERSDFDLNFSSDAMFQHALTQWDVVRFDRSGLTAPLRPAEDNHGYLEKVLVERAFPNLYAWADMWEERLGRHLAPGVFPSGGPEETSTREGHDGVSVHFRDTDFIVQRRRDS